MAASMRYLLQVAAYTAFIVFVGFFSALPSYSPFERDQSLLRVSFSHAGQRIQPCRRYTPEEIAATAPNMRRAMDCVRERVPLRLQLTIDGEAVMDRELPPAGLAGDGASTVYARFQIAPGKHRMVAKLRDSRRDEGFDHVDEFELSIAEGESRVLQFSAQLARFELL